MTLPDIDSAHNWGADALEDFEPIFDPSTEIGAALIKPLAADVAQMTHTAIRAVVRFSCTTYTSGTQSQTVLSHDAVWGSSAPVIPTVTQTATGVYVVTWGSTQLDELGATHTLSLRYPLAPTIVGAAGLAWIASMTTNSVTLNTAAAGGTANSLNGASLIVAWI
jgi:hypothetical protein